MKQYGLLCLLVLSILGSYAQDPTTTPLPIEWNGDPKLCTVDPSKPPPSSTRPQPTFPPRAEFGLERVEVKHILNTTLPSELTLYQYLYDYDANKLILIKNQNGFIDFEHFYYEGLTKATYYRREYCVVERIDQNVDLDGLSAIQLPNGTWHIRPLNEFLLFSSNDPRRPPITPIFIGQDVIRSIPVDIWESCAVNRTSFQTVRRRWAFAQSSVTMPTGLVGNSAVPIQANVSASVSYPNGTEIVEVDEIFNVHSYRPGIIETPDRLIPPKGVFCDSGLGQNLVTLHSKGIEWPNRFSVRVEASSSRSQQWQRFHLRYDRNPRRIRYDYLPHGSEDFHSVIHHYADNLTYTIDRRVGSCTIKRGVEIADVNPIGNPIEFFIKHEEMFLSRERDRIWEFTGYRHCRHDSILCAALTSQIKKFPVIVDPDTGSPSGQTWEATNVEYGWSVRSPAAAAASGYFDYPVYLFLKMYQYGPDGSSPTNVRTEDIEYEFYEMSHEPDPHDFDISICYRSLNYEYLHLGLTLRTNREHIIDRNRLDRRALERAIHNNLRDTLGVRTSRVSDVEVVHEADTAEVNVFFTLLGPTPRPESPTGVAEDEPTAALSQGTLRKSVDEGTFKFTLPLYFNASVEIEFQAVVGSLKASKLFMSTHSVGKKEVTNKYTSGAEAGAVIGGLLIGLFVGIIIAAVIRVVRGDKMPDIPNLPNMTKSFSNPLPNISFYNKKPTSDTTTTAVASSDA